MVARFRALAVCLLVVFLPLVVKSAGPEPLSILLLARSVVGETAIDEPYVEVAVYSTQSPETPLFQGFTGGDGWLYVGLFAELPQSLYIQVKRERADGAMQHRLPLITSDHLYILPRGELACEATYDWDTGVNEVHCDIW